MRLHGNTDDIFLFTNHRPNHHVIKTGQVFSESNKRSVEHFLQVELWTNVYRGITLIQNLHSLGVHCHNNNYNNSFPWVCFKSGNPPGTESWNSNEVKA